MIKVFASISLCALVVGGFYYFDRTQPADEVWWESERYRTDLKNQIEINAMRLDRRENGAEAKRFQAATARLEALVAVFDKRMVEFEALTQENNQIESQFLEFREKTLGELRIRAQGREWKEFIPASGRVFHDVTVLSVDDSGVLLRHRDGSARFGYEDLTEEQRWHFGLDEESAIAAMKEEQQAAREYEAWLKQQSEEEVVQAMVVRNEKEMNRFSASKRPLPKAKRFYAQREVAAVVPGNSSLNVRSLSDPPRRIGENPRFRVRRGSRYQYQQIPYPERVPQVSQPVVLPGSSR